MAAIDPTNYHVTITAAGVVIEGAGFDPSEGSDLMIKLAYLPDKLPDGSQPQGRNGSVNGALVKRDGTFKFTYPPRIITTRPGKLTVSVGQTLGSTEVPVV